MKQIVAIDHGCIYGQNYQLSPTYYNRSSFLPGIHENTSSWYIIISTMDFITHAKRVQFPTFRMGASGHLLNACLVWYVFFSNSSKIGFGFLPYIRHHRESSAMYRRAMAFRGLHLWARLIVVDIIGLCSLNSSLVSCSLLISTRIVAINSKFWSR